MAKKKQKKARVTNAEEVNEFPESPVDAVQTDGVGPVDESPAESLQVVTCPRCGVGDCTQMGKVGAVQTWICNRAVCRREFAVGG